MAPPINHSKIRTNPPTSIQSLVRSSLSTSADVPTSSYLMVPSLTRSWFRAVHYLQTAPKLALLIKS
ncbi:hypothetical protein CCACVL1_23834 [Corchorus capsularis]|uniref:Uncharacterized protein n=1 Tax=Corchorus capsularis TaxID=210143 RepID=A0A1R3GRX5_COCAP|nr:hypothetical protein CCACVL1_23834 [Corchorus capsularis]